MSEFKNMQLNIAVCDDDLLDLQTITELTKEILTGEKIDFSIKIFESAAELLNAIQSGAVFHLLLLDVMMEGLNGMEMASALRNQDNKTLIVFISSNRDMALRGYEVAAARYLSKPVSRDRLREALLFCCREKLEKKDILLPTERGQSRISIVNILYAETWERGVRLNLTNGHVDTSLRISNLAEMLPVRQFVLCHRAFLVNLSFVQTIRYCELELKNGKKIPVSKYRQDEIRKSLMSYLEA